tara:strand:+ start:359 stop:667 length:309 start_codon:yes stop_codon:yes gene_type:complete
MSSNTGKKSKKGKKKEDFKQFNLDAAPTEVDATQKATTQKAMLQKAAEHKHGGEHKEGADDSDPPPVRNPASEINMSVPGKQDESNEIESREEKASSPVSLF